MKKNKFYVVSAEVIESNFPDDLELMLPDMTVIYMDDKPTVKDAKIKNAMGNYLSNDESDYAVLINRLKRLLKNGNGDLSLDGTTGIEVWEKVEGRFTVKEFCDLVGIE